MRDNNGKRVLILSILLLVLITSAYGDEEPPWLITYQPPNTLLPVMAVMDVKEGVLIGPFIGSAEMTGTAKLIGPKGKTQVLTIRMGKDGYSSDVNLDEVGNYTVEEEYTLTVEVSFLSIVIRTEAFTKTHKWNYNNTTAGIKTFNVISNLSNFNASVQGKLEIYSSSLSSIKPGAGETVSVMIRALDDVKKDEVLVSSVTLSGLWDKVSSITTDNTPPTIFISSASQISPNSNVQISFTLLDAENTICIVEAEYMGGSTIGWTPATMSDANVSPGNRMLYWKSIMDEPVAQGLYNIRMRASDGLSYSTWASKSVTLNNTAADTNNPPSAGNVHMIVLDGSTNAVVSRSPITGDKLKAGYTFYDLDGNTESNSSLKWYKYGILQSSVLVSTDQGRILTIPTLKGERWYFTITPSDGTSSGETRQSAEVVIGNAPPRTTYANIQPYTSGSRPTTKDELTANYDYYDPENDPEGASEILWYKNGIQQSLYNGLKKLPASATTRGDTWHFAVRPRDADGAYGERVTSSTVTIVNQKPVVEIGAITGTKDAEGEFVGNVTITYNLKDEDGDICKLSVYYQGGSAGLAKMAAHVLEANDGKSNITNVAPAIGMTLTWQSKSNEPAGKADDYRIGIIADDNNDNVDKGEGISARFSVDNNNQPVATNVAISPPLPFSSNDLTASYTFTDQDGDSEINSEIRWFKNGEEQIALRNMKVISYSLTKREEQWYFTIQPKDGKEFGDKQTSPIVKINNAPPVAKEVRLEPEVVSAEDNLEAFYTYSDADGDPESGTLVKWYMNNEHKTSYDGQMLIPSTDISKDQIWYFTVQPRDGTVLGEIVESNRVSVGNVAPVVRSLTVPKETAFRDVIIKVDLWDADDDKCSLFVEYSGGLASEWTQATIKEPLVSVSRGLVTLTWQSSEDENINKSTNFQVRVTPSDGIVTGITVTSTFFTVDNNEPPVASNLQILPLNPTTADSLTASYTFFDPDGGSESGSEIVWYKNNVQTSFTGPVLTSSGTSKGQKWHYTVKPRDGSKSGEVQTSAPITIVNSPPEARNVVISPSAPSSGDTLTARYTYHDLDNDGESGTEIEWYKNGLLIIKTTVITDADKNLPVPASKGESWHCVVRPKDGFDFGTAATSAAVGVDNALPAVTDIVISGNSGDITIGYSLVDGDGDLCNLNVQYQGGTVPAPAWATATVKESKTGVSPGTGLKLTWTSKIDEGGKKASDYIIRITPQDSVSQGTAGISAKFTLNNNSLPTANNISIFPSEPYTSNNLEAKYVFADPDGDVEGKPEIRWYKGETPQGVYDNRTILPSSATTRGDEWYYTIKVYDGKDYGWTQLSPRVIIRNSPPEATNVVLDPKQPEVGDQLKALYTYVDADGDAQAKLQIRWYRNNTARPEFNDFNVIPSIYTSAGDEWYFTVTPWDAFESGATKTSNRAFIANDPPIASSLTIRPSSPLTTDDLDISYVYTDPEKDPENGSKIVWYKNNEAQPQYNDMDPLPSSATARGQVWYFTIQPRDGKQFGDVKKSETVIIGNTPPVAANLYLSPPYPQSKDDLLLKYDYVDADGDKEGNTEIRWYRNDIWVQAYNGFDRLPSKETLAGQIWYVKVRPKDDRDYGEMVSSEPVEIDSPIPRVQSLTILPGSPKTTNELEAIYAYSDPRGIPEGASKIVWYKNGEPVAEYSNTKFLPADATSKGESWAFSVKPFNAGGLSGEEQRSLPVIIANSAPILTDVRVQPDEPTTDDNIVVDYVYYDADGDPEAKNEINWFRKGELQPSYVLQSAYNDSSEIPASATKRNDKWYFTIRSRDDTVFSDLMTSDPLIIKNGLPRATGLNISPIKPLTDDDLKVAYNYTDTEGAAELGTEIRWYRKGPGESDFSHQLSYDDQISVPASATERDDDWYCTVKPKDGVDFGKMVTSVTMTISNTPPVTLEMLAASGQVLRGSSVLIISYGQDNDSVDNGPDGTLACQISYRFGINAWAALTVQYVETPSPRWQASFTPEPGAELGEYDFRCRFVDGMNEMSSWLVREKMITIENSPPKIYANAGDPFILDNFIVTEDIIREIDLRDYVDDVEDGKTLVWTLDANSVDEELFYASISDNRHLEITPAPNKFGQDDITLTVADSDGGVTEKSDVTIIISPVNDSPSIPTSVTITPENPRTTDSLTCVAVGSVDPDGDSVIYRYKWYKNGTLQEDLKSDTVPSAKTYKGDVWRCEVIPTDGNVDGQSRSGSATVLNSLPEVTIRTVSGNTKNIKVNFDLRDADTEDDCDLTVEYWVKNRWKSATITESTRSVKQGTDLSLTWQSYVDEADTVTTDCRLRITPNDGILSGSAGESGSFSLDNLPPGLTVTAVANPMHPLYVDVTVLSDEELAEAPSVSAAMGAEQPFDLTMQSIGSAIWTGKMELKQGFDGIVTISVEATDLVGNVGEKELQKEFQIAAPLPQPEEFALRQNYPNPIRVETSIPYELPQSLIVTIRIYDVSGRLVRTLDEGYRVAGYYITKDRAARWDGRDDNGIRVASGVYFYCLKAGNYSDVKKMIVSR